MINFPLSSFCHKKNPSPLYFWIEGLIIPGNSLSKFVAWNRLSLEGFFVDVKNRRLVLFLPEYLENWGRKSQEIAHVIHQTISIHLVTYICCRAELTLSYFKGLIFFSQILLITLWYIGTSRKEEVSTCLPKFWCQLSFVAKNDPLLYWQIVTEPRKYCSRVNDELVLPGGGKKRQLNTERGEGFTKTR